MRNRKWKTGNEKPEIKTGSEKQEVRNRKWKTGNEKQEMRNRK